MRSLTAANAYKRSATFRTVREQEADVFHRVNAQLRNAIHSDQSTRARALADNERLWITLADVLRDPNNPLPSPLRASLVSIGCTVRREVTSTDPDFGFLISINEQIAAGLAGA